MRHRLSGTVTLDGEAVPIGEIQFEAPDGSIHNEMARIRAGKYDVQLEPGERLVRIRWVSVVEGQTDERGRAISKEMIPEKYNRDTTLKITVSSDRVENFVLVTK